jgi:hypothetical protein
LKILFLQLLSVGNIESSKAGAFKFRSHSLDQLSKIESGTAVGTPRSKRLPKPTEKKMTRTGEGQKLEWDLSDAVEVSLEGQ